MEGLADLSFPMETSVQHLQDPEDGQPLGHSHLRTHLPEGPSPPSISPLCVLGSELTGFCRHLLAQRGTAAQLYLALQTVPSKEQLG